VSIILALLYPIAIQVERGGWWYLLAPVTLIVLLVDVIANYTELALLTLDWPKSGEWTFSTRCKRLQHDTGWRGRIARVVRDYTNFFDPQGEHIV
jgi:predicted metal-dependent hydrolase